MFPPSRASRYGGQSRTTPATITPNPRRRADAYAAPISRIDQATNTSVRGRKVSGAMSGNTNGG